MTHHHHEDSGAGFFAGMSAMMFMLVGLVLLILVIALFAWQPWGTTSDGDALPGGGIQETLPGQPGGGTDDGDNNGTNGGGGAAPGSYRFNAEGMPSVVAAESALTGPDWTPQAA